MFGNLSLFDVIWKNCTKNYREEMRHGVFWRLWEHFMISIWNSITHPISDSYFSRME